MKITVTTHEYEIILKPHKSLVKDTIKFIKHFPVHLHETLLLKAVKQYNEGDNVDTLVLTQAALNYIVGAVPHYKRKHVMLGIYEDYVEYELRKA